jgi:hypothetical protein
MGSPELAVTLAARGGFLQDAGLANERYADFLLRDVPDEDEAAHRMEEAIRFYGNWGAARKVDRLRVEAASAISSCLTVVSCEPVRFDSLLSFKMQ